jgi:hypothetical protein
LALLVLGGSRKDVSSEVPNNFLLHSQPKKARSQMAAKRRRMDEDWWSDLVQKASRFQICSRSSIRLKEGILGEWMAPLCAKLTSCYDGFGCL